MPRSIIAFPHPYKCYNSLTTFGIQLINSPKLVSFTHQLPKNPSTVRTYARAYLEALEYVLEADSDKQVSLVEACRIVSERAVQRKIINAPNAETFARTLRRTYQRSRAPKKKKRDKRRLLNDAEEQLVAGIAEGMARAGKTVKRSTVTSIAQQISTKNSKKSLFTKQWSMLPLF